MFGLPTLSKVINANVSKPSINVQIVRWRKPRWIPIAKSKMFRVPEHPPIDPDQHKELMRLHNNYRTYMKSIRRYLYNKTHASLASASNPKDIQRTFEEDFVRCSKINDGWNAAAQEDREKFFADELEQRLNIAKESVKRRQAVTADRLEQAEQLVLEQKEAAKTFITADNIDAAIEQALANTADYNFAIDLEGNKHYNKDTQGM